MKALAALANHSVEWPVFAHARVVMPFDDVDCFVVSLANSVAIDQDVPIQGFSEQLLRPVADGSRRAYDVRYAGLGEHFAVGL